MGIRLYFQHSLYFWGYCVLFFYCIEDAFNLEYVIVSLGCKDIPLWLICYNIPSSLNLFHDIRFCFNRVFFSISSPALNFITLASVLLVYRFYYYYCLLLLFLFLFVYVKMLIFSEKTIGQSQCICISGFLSSCCLV